MRRTSGWIISRTQAVQLSERTDYTDRDRHLDWRERTSIQVARDQRSRRELIRLTNATSAAPVAAAISTDLTGSSRT
jgi:hypothetical protein